MTDTTTATDISNVRLVIEGETLEWNGRLRLQEGIALEKALGMTIDQWSSAIQAGSLQALAGLVWLIKRKQNPTLKITEVDFELDSIEIETVGDGAEATPTAAVAN